MAWPDEIEVDASTAVVSLVHEERLDLPALQAGVAGGAFYVGALGSRRTQEKRRAALGDEVADRVRGPVGLEARRRDAGRDRARDRRRDPRGHEVRARTAPDVTAYAALLRGINVGGKNKVPMPELKALFEELGFADVVDVHPERQRRLPRGEGRRRRDRAADQGGLRLRRGGGAAHGRRARRGGVQATRFSSRGAEHEAAVRRLPRPQAGGGRGEASSIPTARPATGSA